MMRLVFSRISGFIMSRAGSMLIGVLVLVALIWFGGPYINIEDANTRWVIIAVILGIALLYVIVSWLIAKRRGAKLQRDLQDQASDGSQAEIQALKQKMTEAIASLKTSKLGLKHRGTAALYALPWYMIIGPSAAGKSTLLRNSGLHFPYSHSDDIDIKGFGGTRNCDWWFSDEAVILDTAGRYTTEEDDHGEWISFLDLLKKHRHKMPINGIIVAISISDILTADEESLEWHIKVIRGRIDELINELGFLFPLYLIFTKCDLLNGFQSYFAELSDKEREQVWGSVVECIGPHEEPTEIIGGVLDQLYVRLCELRLKKLSLQRKHSIKSEIYDFPAQFQAASDRLIEFINLLFKDNPYQELPNLKGIFFTSGTQEGLPLQRVVGNLRQAFGYVDQRAEDQSKSEKSYFINELLRNVIFKASRDVHMGRRKRLVTRGLKSIAVLGGFAIIVSSVLLFSTAFTRNALLMKNGTDVVEQLASVSMVESAVSVEYYDTLVIVYRQYLALLMEKDDYDLVKRIGYYRADLQIEPLRDLIISAMKKNFFVPVAQLLENRLNDFSIKWREAKTQVERSKFQSDYYETLRVYLMISDPSRLNDDEAFPLLYLAWREVIVHQGQSDAKRKLAKIPEDELKALVKLYLTHMHYPADQRFEAASWKANSRYVQLAQSDLRTPATAEILYAWLKNKGQMSFKEEGLQQILKSRGSNYFQSKFKLPMIFTRNSWETFVSDEIVKMVAAASRGDWVLATDLDSKGDDTANVIAGSDNSQLRMTELEHDIRRMYFNEYVNNWLKFFGSIRLRGLTSISDAANKLQWLSRQDGPIVELLQFVSDNINLAEIEATDSIATTLVATFNETKGEEAEKSESVATPVAELESPFADLRRFSDAAPDKQVNDHIEQYLAALTGIQMEMERLRTSSEREREAELYAASILGGSGEDTELYMSWTTTTGILNGTDLSIRRMVEPWVMRPIRDSWNIVLSAAMKEVQQKWINMVVNEYDERIRGRFPFSSTGSDAAIDDVAEFFRPDDGILWSFVNEHLASYLVKNRSRWRERSWLGLGAGFTPSFIRVLSRSAHVTRALFKRGGDSVDVTFDLYPMPSSGLSEIMLETNGQVYRYRNEPQEWRRFSWPGDAVRSGARIVGVSDRNNIRVEINVQGLWGLFHLLDKAKLVKEGGAQYMSVWTMHSANDELVRVRFKIKADRNDNVFTPGLMPGLIMPERLAKFKLSNNSNLAIKE